jgi:hypothetical protein
MEHCYAAYKHQNKGIASELSGVNTIKVVFRHEHTDYGP